MTLLKTKTLFNAKSLFLMMALASPLAHSASSKGRLSDYLPSSLIQLSDYFSHHVLVAEKSTHELHLFKNENGKPSHIKTYQMATGKKAGNKVFQGDHKTPEGIYHFNNFLTHEELIQKYGKAGEIYGVGAFVMNYPNPIDRRLGKTGGGIWLHSTNDETRIDKGLDSRGCIVTANNDLKEISTFLELNKTSVVVVQDMHLLKPSTFKTNKNALNSLVRDWVDSWRTEDIKKYLDFYHPEKYFDPYRGNYNSFSKYKKSVFRSPGQPEIKITDLTIFQTPLYALAMFKQHYKSSTIQDVGQKTLYLQKDSFYKWKIVAEHWGKLPLDHNQGDGRLAFQPSMRFFKEKKEEQN